MVVKMQLKLAVNWQKAYLLSRDCSLLHLVRRLGGEQCIGRTIVPRFSLVGTINTFPMILLFYLSMRHPPTEHIHK